MSRFSIIVEPELLGKPADLLLVEINLETVLAKAREVLFPDLEGSILIESGVVKADMDAGSECFVELAYTIGCQDNDSREVFKDS